MNVFFICLSFAYQRRMEIEWNHFEKEREREKGEKMKQNMQKTYIVCGGSFEETTTSTAVTNPNGYF